MMFRISVPAIVFYQTQAFENNGAAQQFNGREAETATLFGTSSVTFYVVAGGFRPRHLSRCAASLIAPLDEISDDC